MVRLGQATTRAYDGILRRIALLELRPGARVEPASLAEKLDSSITPVRDALHILSGEGVIDIRPGEGYFVVRIDETELTNLYDWNLDLLLLALRRASAKSVVLPAAADDTAMQTALLFSAIVGTSSNPAHSLAMRWTNVRLSAARTVEAQSLTDVNAEIAIIRNAISNGNVVMTRKLLNRYHQARKRMVRKLITALRDGARVGLR